MTMTAAPTGEEAPPAAVAVSTGKAPPPPQQVGVGLNKKSVSS